LRLVEEHPDLKMTFNISGCLLERLVDAKEDSFLERLKFLVKKKRIELTGSAYYHGFLPLLPEKEVIRQIRANEKNIKKYFW
jgi:alpha-amylase/alpha-mannosidase (GH57 family)